MEILMKTIFYNEKSIIIEKEKKTLFSTKKVERELKLDDIDIVSRDEYEGELIVLTIYMKNAMEEHIKLEEYENIEGLYKFLVEQKKNGKTYKLQSFDVDTSAVKEIYMD